MPAPDPPASPARSRSSRFLRYWLPVLLWMALIFGVSTDIGSSRRTSRFIGPVLRWLIPNVSEETIETVQLVVRKGGHLTEYAVLAGLLWRARRQPTRRDSRPWRTGDAVFAISVATLCAISDELHQSTVPSRQGQFSDVCIDFTGACAGMAGVWIVGRRRKKW